MLDALILDSRAINKLLQHGGHSSEWLDSIQLPPGELEIECRVIGKVGLIFAPNLANAPRMLVIRLDEGRLFPSLRDEDRPEAFFRLLKGALSFFDSAVAIPGSWGVFKSGSRVSYFMVPKKRSSSNLRLVFDTRPNGLPHVYMFDYGSGIGELKSLEPDYAIFNSAIAVVASAKSSSATTKELVLFKRVVLDLAKVDLATDASLNEDTPTSVDLTEGFQSELSQGIRYQQWYESKLTTAQRTFVDAPLTQSMRLRGPAGTGKSLALVMKCLRSMYDAYDKSEALRIAFLTHNASSVEYIRRTIIELDDRGIFFDHPANIQIELRTLQELANESLRLDFFGVDPISNDGHEGRKFQLEVIAYILEEFKKKNWDFYIDDCSDPFRRYMEADSVSAAGKYFAYELMNEFGCVLDADGVRDSVERQRKYLSEERRKWMMPLTTEAERRVVLEMYKGFRKELRDMKTISQDQVVADFLAFLDSNRWDVMRETRGYDLCLVDELHLFNRQERMVFHHLMRDGSMTPVVLMAYDAKQSPRDTFVGLTEKDRSQFDFWRDAKLGDVRKFELKEAFRYTPEICRVIRLIDQSFPGIDLEEEWSPFDGQSAQESGGLPSVSELPDIKSEYAFVFSRARAEARRLGRGRKVAVLTCSQEAFESYLIAGEFKDNFVSVTSREEVENLNTAGKRFILSMPEFVAGLQFDVVYLIDVNNGEVPEGPHATGAMRRFVSQVYLGASRASKVLEFYGTADGGGVSKVLDLARKQGAIRAAEIRKR